MVKLVLLSVLFAMIAIPARAARSKNPKQGLKRAILLIFVFNLIYAYAVFAGAQKLVQ